MKLWTFLFPDPAAPVVSARVAASDRSSAMILLAHGLAEQGRDLPDQIICQWGGELGEVAPGVLRIVDRQAA